MAKATKQFSDMPAWYRRIMSNPKVCDGRVEVNPEWFDEDISDIDEKPSEEKVFECRCEAADDSDIECYCDSDDESYETVSERSYQDDDADFYYELKEQREERKIALKQQRETFEREKKDELRFHKRRVKEVRVAYEALKEKEKLGDGPPITILEDSEYVAKLKKDGKKVPKSLMTRGKTFNLYCADYVENYYNGDGGSYWRYIEFNEHDFGVPEIGSKKRKRTSTHGKTQELDVIGHIYVNCDAQIDFSTVAIPDRASTKIHWSDPWKNKHKVGVQFIGQDYVRVTVSRDIIKATERDPLPASCPEVLEFMGIDRASPKLRALEEKATKKRAARRGQKQRTSDSDDGYNYY